jgi:mycoredoxin
MIAECVTVYMKESCPYSQGLIRKLEHDGVDYVRYEVDKDPVRLEEMLSLNGGRRVVPTVVWPDKSVEVGFHGQ